MIIMLLMARKTTCLPGNNIIIYIVLYIIKKKRIVTTLQELFIADFRVWGLKRISKESQSQYGSMRQRCYYGMLSIK